MRDCLICRKPTETLVCDPCREYKRGLMLLTRPSVEQEVSPVIPLPVIVKRKPGRPRRNA